MLNLDSQDPLAVAVTRAVRAGDLDALTRLLDENPGLARARITDSREGCGPGGRSLLHIVADWPGHVPGGPRTIAALVAAGADADAFVVDEDDQVSCDEDFVFYGAPESPDGAVRLLTDGPTEQTVTADLAALPPAVRRVVIAAAIDGTPPFGDIGAIQVTTGPGGSAAPLEQAALDAATTERTMLVAEPYRRCPLWRYRAVGQGYDHGPAALTRGYGVDVMD